MSRMDWNAPSCSYTVGTGSKQVSISRTGDHTTIRGGEITGLSFRNKSMWGDDWQADFGWHTEGGTYTFQDVILNMHGSGDIEVWAHKGEHYKIVLEKSVKGARGVWDPDINDFRYEAISGGFGIHFTLCDAANVELVNHTTLRGTYGTTLSLSSEKGCAFTLSGTGKVYPPEDAMTRDIDYPRNIHMSIIYSALADHDQAAMPDILEMVKNTRLDKSQFAGTYGDPQLYLFYSRHLPSFEGFDFSLNDVGVLIERSDSGESSSLSAGSGDMQIVVSGLDDGAKTLQTKIYPLGENSSLCFGNLVDADGFPWWLQYEAQLYIPYPDGITEATADQYIFTAEYPSLFGGGKTLITGSGITSTPYGLRITIDEMLPFTLSWEEKRLSGHVKWEEIVSGEYAQYAPAMTVAKADGQYIIDGGNETTITGLHIDCTDESLTMGKGAYTFRSAAIAGDVSALSVSNYAITLNLEKSVVMDGRVSLEAGTIRRLNDDGDYTWENVGYGDITANIACDTKSISLTPVKHSVIRLNNEGTTGGLGMECCDHSRAEIVNRSKTGGTILQFDHSTGHVVSECNVIYLACWLWNSDVTFINNADYIHLLNIDATLGSSLKFVNNAVITNSTPDPESWDGNEWGDYSALIGIDESSSIEFSGSGSIMPGTQMFDYYTGDSCEPKDGASVVFKVVMPEVTDDHAANRQKVFAAAKNVDFDWSQVRKHEGANHVIAVRRDTENPEYSYVIDMIQPESILQLPKGLKTLERSAFEGCGAIEAIAIPSSVTFIGEDAFAGCPGAVLIVTPDSYAEAYARANGLRFTYAK